MNKERPRANQMGCFVQRTDRKSSVLLKIHILLGKISNTTINKHN